MDYKKIVVSTLFCSVSLFANDIVNYIGIGVAKQNVNNKNFDKGSALVITTGKNNIYSNLGLEVEGSVQLNKPSATIGSVTSDLKFWSMGMYGTYLWKIDDITIKPRLGLVYENIKSSFNVSNSNPTKPTDKNKLAITGGIGLSYKITNKTKIYTNYTKFEDDIEHLTFGAEFKF